MKEKQRVSNATTDTREVLAQQGVIVGQTDIEYAGMLSGYLVDVIEFDQTAGITGIDVPFSINDILHGLMRLRQCRQLLEELGIETYPCQIFGDQPVPLDWLQASEDLYAADWVGFSRLKEPWHRIASFRQLWGHPLEELPFKKVRELVTDTLRQLLEIRSALKDKTPDGRCGERVHLTVRTEQHNLEIGYSSLGNWRQLGYPTDPVKNCIPAGRYYFRARKYGSGRWKDVFVDDNLRTIFAAAQIEKLPV
jgi:hypothetical protein